jgi:hypothetical protein
MRRAALTILVLLACASPATAAAAPNDIFTVAGIGQRGSSGDGGPAALAQLGAPRAVAATADGGFLIVDPFDGRVRRVSPTGTITTVAGNGTFGFSGDGGPATAAALANPTGVAATPDGGFLIADFTNERVRRVSPAGTITTVAGNGTRGVSGDGGSATAAALDDPTSVAALPDGGFLLTDTFTNRVRRVSPTGTITTVAGNGTSGFSGDGGPAADAELNDPFAVVATADGGFLIADAGNFRVRRVSPNGTITTEAGDGTFGFSGDGGPATAAQLNDPIALAATPDGGFLIAEPFAQRVRRVSPAGTITTVAGDGTPGFSGDGGPATAAQLNFPTGVAATPGGGFLIADFENSRVRFVDAHLNAPPAPPAPSIPPPAPGLQGPPGPPAPSGPPTVRHRLTVTLANRRLRIHHGRQVLIRYTVTTRARVRATITGTGTRSIRSTVTVGPGRHTLRLVAPTRHGRYVLTLTADSANRQHASDHARLDVTG